MDAACHYCERPAAFAVTIRSGATETGLVQRQRLCEVHDAIVASLRSVLVLDRRAWLPLPPTDTHGTIITGQQSTVAAPATGVRSRLRGLVGR